MITLHINDENNERYLAWCYEHEPTLDQYKYCTHFVTQYIFHNNEKFRDEFRASTVTTLEDDDSRFDFIYSKNL